MDKKNLIFGVLCLVAAFGVTIWSGIQQQHHAAEQAAIAAAAGPVKPAGNVTAGPVASTSASTPVVAPVSVPILPPTAGAGGLLASSAEAGQPATYVLENDNIQATFTEAGGAIATVALKKFPAQLHGTAPVVFNQGAPQPALGLSLSLPVEGGTGLPPVPVDGRFALVQTASTNTSLSFHFQSAEGLEITRTYTISAAGNTTGDPYVIEHETRFVNHGSTPVQLSRLFINTGMAPPTPGAGYLIAQYLDFGYYNGESAKFISTSRFSSSPGLFWGLLPIGQHDALPYLAAPAESGAELQWVSVKNEFFAGVLTPQSGLRGSGYFAQAVPLMLNGNATTSVTGDMEVNLGILAPGQDRALAVSYFVGPKEYVRLDKLGDRQDLVMEFGWMGGLSKFLLLILIALHTWLVHLAPTWAWGWAIVIFTICIKLVTWPLTQVQVRSAKRMAAIQKPLAEVREKYKDNPQKLQSEMMELFKKNKVNPAAGCVPLLIQLPIFFAFYGMLRTASELRFASFLWIHDLSAPDTVGHLFGISVNILPLLMSGTTFFQMRLTPSPTTDNAQRTMLQFMPLMMLFFMYTMPSGMTLYWTCQNLFTIGQQLLTNRMKDPVAPVVPGPGKGPAASKALPRPVMKKR
jgi:YidC/Oxa1 family membrane protein insertase